MTSHKTYIYETMKQRRIDASEFISPIRMPCSNKSSMTPRKLSEAMVRTCERRLGWRKSICLWNWLKWARKAGSRMLSRSDKVSVSVRTSTSNSVRIRSGRVLIRASGSRSVASHMRDRRVLARTGKRWSEAQAQLELPWPEPTRNRIEEAPGKLSVIQK